MREQRVSFKRALNDAIRSSGRSSESVPFHTAAVRMGTPTVNLDRAIQLAAELEDEEPIRKLRAGS